MKLLTKTALTLSAITLLAGTSLTAAWADYKPNRKDTGPTREQIEEMGYTGILPLDQARFRIGQDADSKPYEFNLYVRIPLQLEGCYSSIPYELDKKIEGPTVTIEMKYPIIKLDAHKDCEKKRSMELEKIAINLDELKENNVNMLRLTSRYGTRSFKVEFSDEYVRLIPTESKLLDTIEHWFLPQNAVMLIVPMAKDDIYYKNNLLQELAMVAEQKGLIPIENQIENYMPQINPYNQFYFLDTKGAIRSALDNGENSVNIGSIHTSEPFYGPNGKYDKKVPLNVIATLPYAIY